MPSFQSAHSNAQYVFERLVMLQCWFKAIQAHFAGSMSCLTVAIKVVICAALSLIVVKLAIDQQRVDWHSKKFIHTEKCTDVVLGPEMRLDWPNWRIFADQLAQETQAADEKEASLENQGSTKGMPILTIPSNLGCQI